MILHSLTSINSKKISSTCLLFCWILFFLSCKKGNQSRTLSATNSSTVKTLEEVIEEDCFFKVVNNGKDNYEINWGNSSFTRNERIEQNFDLNKVYCDNEKMILEFSCGAPCWGYLFLPMKHQGNLRVLTYPIGNSENYNVVLTGSEKQENQINVYNFSIRKEGELIIDSLDCLSTFYTDCLDVLSVTENNFTININKNIVRKYELEDILN